MKIEENREKSRCKNDVFFDCLFLLILEGFGEDFGMVLGGVWSLLVPLGALFGIIFWGFPHSATQLDKCGTHQGSWRVPGWILTPFWRVWDGSGEDFGKVLGELGGSKL